MTFPAPPTHHDSSGVYRPDQIMLRAQHAEAKGEPLAQSWNLMAGISRDLGMPTMPSVMTWTLTVQVRDGGGNCPVRVRNVAEVLTFIGAIFNSDEDVASISFS